MNEAQEEERWKKEIEIRLEILESLGRRDGNERERNKENLKSILDEGEEKRKKKIIKGVELKNNKEKMEEWMMTKLRMLQKVKMAEKLEMCTVMCAFVYARLCARICICVSVRDSFVGAHHPYACAERGFSEHVTRNDHRSRALRIVHQ